MLVQILRKIHDSLHPKTVFAAGTVHWHGDIYSSSNSPLNEANNERSRNPVAATALMCCSFC